MDQHTVKRLDAAVGGEVVGAGVDLVDAKAGVDSVRELGAMLSAAIGDERHRALSESIMYRSMKTSTIPTAADCAAVAANILTRRLTRLVSMNM